jgi:hypothetical protein
MRKTKQSIGGTSFHGQTIYATPAQLRTAMGEPYSEVNDGKDKVNMEWEMETDNGNVFSVYDWKEYRPLDEFERIEWHIGAKDASIARQAHDELKEALRN